jgi:hypothetical protein
LHTAPLVIKCRRRRRRRQKIKTNFRDKIYKVIDTLSGLGPGLSVPPCRIAYCTGVPHP